MITFDQLVPILKEVLEPYAGQLLSYAPLLVNRDLNGRVRLIVKESAAEAPDAKAMLDEIAHTLSQTLGKHAFEPEQMLLFEPDMDAAMDGVKAIPFPGVEGVLLVDRLANEGQWARIAPPASGAPRVVFFSIKGGVGRSTSLAIAAWSLAQAGKRVLVLDLDLESPGLSSSVLPMSHRPAYGITDWLVEDLVDNGGAVFDDMVASSPLSHDGEIHVVPAHGTDPGDYIAKLGRVWMPKVSSEGQRESWSQRLNRLLDALEVRWQPDVMLIDSRSGIGDVASSCVTDLGASQVLLFALGGEQTWSGYRLLFEYWHRAGVAQEIRERLQLVGAMIPEIDSADYLAELREQGWDLFSESLYDEIPPGETGEELWSFDDHDAGAPHYPWPIHWHRGFAAMTSLYSHLQQLDERQVEATFGALLDGLRLTVMQRSTDND